ncbi:hypothetical protein [Nonomuraea endophytica]|uniref:hypothetical protein n=1 Tax=Nonomuraea endophytica TaxID=714136 RepID=UPI0037C6269B
MRRAWLCHPATLAAALVLLINDHVLKAAWPGLVTGKLSDVAGLVVAAPLVSLLFARRADLAATVLTAVVFTLVKTTGAGAELASAAWTLVAGPSRVLADPTDLLALPALGLAWWIRKHEAPRRWSAVVGVPLAVLAVGATGPAGGPPAAQNVYLDGGHIVITGRWTFGTVSSDGGRTWRAVTGNGTAPKPRNLAPRTSVCGAEFCYRIVAGRLKVERSADGERTWTSAWEVSPGRTEWLKRGHVGDGRPKDPRSLALALQERPDGHVVVVANGRDGIVVRDTGGTWRRYGYGAGGGLSTGAAVPLTGPGERVDGEMRVAVLAGLWMLLAGLVAVTPEVVRSGRVTLSCGLIGVLLLLPWRYEEFFGYYSPINLPGVVGAAVGVSGGVLLLIVLAGAALAAWREGAAGDSVREALCVAVLVGAGVALPFRGWSAGWPDGYAAALALAGLFGLGLGAAGLVILRRNALRRSAAIGYLAGSSTSSPR